MAAMHRASICQMEINGFSSHTLKCERKGGWFLTKRYAFILGMGAVLMAAIVGVVVHVVDQSKYKEPTPVIEEPLDAAKKLFLSWDTTVQLPSLSFDLDPTEYSVVLELTNFTKTGTSTINGFVAIEIECHSDTKNVSVHVPQHGMKINMERIYIKEPDNDTVVLRVIWAEEDYEGQTLKMSVGSPGFKAEHTYVLEINYVLNSSAVPLEGYFLTDEFSKTTMIFAGSSGARQVFPCFDQSEILTPIQFTILGVNSVTPVAAPIWQQIETNGTNEVSWRTMRSVDLSSIAFALVDESTYTLVEDYGIDLIYTDRPKATQELSSSIANVKKRLSDYLGYIERDISTTSVLLPDINPAATAAQLSFLAKNQVLDEDVRPPEGLQVERAITPVVIRQSLGFYPRNESYLVESLVALLQYKIEQLRTGHNYFVPLMLQPALRVAEHRFISGIKDPVITPVPAVSSDLVTVAKGAAILHMINQSMPEAFLQSLQISLMDPDVFDARLFWEELENATEAFFPDSLKLSKMLISWSEQRGFPILNITRNQVNGSVFVKQVSYSYLWSNETGEELPDWVIPVRIRAQHPRIPNNPEVLWLTGINESILFDNVTMPNDFGWIVTDPKLTGFYLTLYEESNYERLSGAAAVLGPDVRCRLVNDVLQLAWAKQLNYTIALDVVRSMLSVRPHIMPWLCAKPGLNRIGSILRHRPVYSAFQDMITELLKPVFNDQVFEARPSELLNSDPDETAQLKTLSTSLLCSLEDATCVDWAKKHFTAWQMYNKSVPALYRETIFCSAVWLGGRIEWTLTYDAMQRQDRGVRARLDLLSALTCTREEALLQRLLESTLLAGESSNSSMTFSEAAHVWTTMPSRTSSAAEEAFEFMRANWPRIQATYKTSEYMLSSIIQGGTEGIFTSEELEQLLEFIAEYGSTMGLERITLKWQLEKVVNNIQWTADHQAPVEGYLKSLKSLGNDRVVY